jgi:hypothetical protein
MALGAVLLENRQDFVGKVKGVLAMGTRNSTNSHYRSQKSGNGMGIFKIWVRFKHKNQGGYGKRPRQMDLSQTPLILA